jgi:hypothetical protein
MDYTETFLRLRNMPPLSHWPGRPAPYRDEASQVVGYIRRVAGCDLATAARLMHAAAKKKVILFDKSTLKWSGNRDWVPHGTKAQTVA